ncbi:MAG: competence/damage-inducible protein A [Dethiobacteria bacterium]|jgi:nicotinamide-nucleotide amidase
MHCEIIAVGTELLLGHTVNTNARDIARELSALGIGVFYQSVVGDNEERLADTFSRALQRSDLIVLCGGLGPTEDDLTRETVARVLGLPLERNEEWEKRIESFFRRLQRPMVENNRRQAMVPRGGRLLPNERGTAPGIFLENKGKKVVMLPGPPRELLPMLKEQVVPLLREGLEDFGDLAVLHSKILRVIGLGESDLVEKIRVIIAQQGNPTIAPVAKGAEVHLRITARAPTKEQAEVLINQVAMQLRGLLGDHIYGEDDEELELVVARLLFEKGKTLAIAESCSGGLLSHRLTNIPGSSAYFLAGLVTYSNEAKMKLLGVDAQVLETKGAVSAEVAEQMSAGVRLLSKADIGIGITGIAGPGGETPEKPVGLTYIALQARNINYVRRYEFWGSRQDIKERSSQTALALLRLYLMGKLEG